MKFIKENWFLIAVILVAFFFLRKWGTGYYDYRRENRSLSDSIVKLDAEYSLLQERLSASIELTQEAINESRLYHDSLNQAKTKIRINKIRYENQIANLKRIPTDSLYVNVTDWLDNLSIVWGSD